MAEQVQETVISATPVAVEKIKGLIAEKEMPAGTGLRVFVAGGGCSGLQYGMAFEPNPREDDSITDVNGIRIIIDPVSMDYLNGANIDYVDSLMGAGFSIDNPNAVSSCGCGHSFRTDDQAGGAAHGDGCSCH